MGWGPRGEVPRRVLAGSLGRVDQEVLFFGGSVEEKLTLWDPTIPRLQLEAACRDAGILDTVLALPGGFEASLLEGASNLSGGERRRLEIARALITRPKLLLLDEPFAGVDPHSVEELQREVRRLVDNGIAMLITDHNVQQTLRLCDRAYIIHDGKNLSEGTPRAIINDPARKSVV